MKQLLLFVLTLLPVTASADESGKCGANTYYSYDSATHTLTIYGEGRIDVRDFAEDLRPWRFYESDIHTVIIESGVTSVGIYSFVGCSNLASVAIPSSVKCIEDCAFRGCSGLTTMTIPYGVTSIGNDDWGGAFQACTGLTSITIPSSVTDIGDKTFSGCSSLSTVISEIENPFAIDNSVFDGIPSNATLIVPPGTKSAYQSKAGWNKFANIVEIEKKQTIHVATAGTLPDLIPDYEKYYIEELTLTGELNGTDLAFLREMAGQDRMICFFNDDSDLFDLKYGEYLPQETQGKLIDLDISNVNIVSGGSPSLYLLGDADEIYSSDNTIPAGLFFDCKLSSIKLPRSISNIESLALGHCPLTYITIPNSVTSISDDVFYGCSSLESIVVENGNAKYDSRNNCKAIIETESNTLIAGCKNTIIPNSVTSIGSDAFYGCSGLTSVNIGNSVTSIGNYAFYGCSGLTSVNIGNSVTSIGNYAFYGCSGLTSVTIPNSVTSIGSSAFYGCSGLIKIISEIENPFSIVDNVFSCYDKDIYASATLVVPPGKKSVYQNTNGWNLFSNIVEAELIGYEFESGGIRYWIGQNNTVSVISKKGGYYSGDVVIPSSVVYHGKTYSVTSIGGSAFFGCDYLTSVTIPNSVTTIGDMAFQECGLTSITIPNSVTRIGFEVFKLCSLTSVTIPNSVTSIGGDAFSECSGLTSVTIPSSVTSIAYTAFSDCRGLASIKVESGNEKYDSRNNCNAIIESASNTLITGCKNSTIPNGVTSIGEYAFSGCSGLTSVTIPNSVTSIGSSAFSYCSSLTSVTIPNSVTSIGNYAFSGCSCLTKIISEIENPFSISDNAFYCYFKDIYASATLVVPPGKKSAYQSKAGWNKFQNIEESVGVTVTAISYSIVYGDALPIYGYISTGAALSGTPSISCSATAASPVGTYTITVSKGSVTNKYDSYVNGTLTINKAPLTVTAKNYIIKQGQALPTFEATYSGLKNSETSSVLTTQPSFSCSATSASEPGTYDIIVSGAAAQNYSMSYVKGTLTITADDTPVLLGDANNDGVVDAADIVELVNAMAGHPSASFNLNNADANADGSFTEADITATADIIMKR